ncbi:hypothetical protein L1987_54697 [Smallanthus sonchifolius]|uniref:Uncharacterized protein n=1 Tax=Smallanthus sonchifolius TaxID=185202 RepID=A0ACB9E7Q6_9ASTR|nr:hypothetical protein L1987_54697 [Smallanthus sonchifolius]
MNEARGYSDLLKWKIGQGKVVNNTDAEGRLRLLMHWYILETKLWTRLLKDFTVYYKNLITSQSFIVACDKH